MGVVAPPDATAAAVWAFAFFAGAYFVGGIPWALLIARRVGHVDLRTVGSGNLGSTNISRVLGRKWAITVFFLDAAKGALPVAIAALLAAPEWRDVLMAAAFMGAVVGHIRPPYIRQGGGKGVATTAGAALVALPVVLVIGVVAFFAVAYLTSRVSAGSLAIAAIVIPSVLLLYPGNVALLVLGVFITATLIFTHRSNIGRLVRGEEPTVSWGMRSSRKGGAA